MLALQGGNKTVLLVLVCVVGCLQYLMRKRAWAVVALFQCRLTRAQAGLASCEKALERAW